MSPLEGDTDPSLIILTFNNKLIKVMNHFSQIPTPKKVLFVTDRFNGLMFHGQGSKAF